MNAIGNSEEKLMSELEELGFQKESLKLALKFSKDKEEIINMYV